MIFVLISKNTTSTLDRKQIPSIDDIFVSEDKESQSKPINSKGNNKIINNKDNNKNMSINDGLKESKNCIINYKKQITDLIKANNIEINQLQNPSNNNISQSKTYPVYLIDLTDKHDIGNVIDSNLIEKDGYVYGLGTNNKKQLFVCNIAKPLLIQVINDRYFNRLQQYKQYYSKYNYYLYITYLGFLLLLILINKFAGPFIIAHIKHAYVSILAILVILLLITYRSMINKTLLYKIPLFFLIINSIIILLVVFLMNIYELNTLKQYDYKDILSKNFIFIYLIPLIMLMMSENLPIFVKKYIITIGISIIWLGLSIWQRKNPRHDIIFALICITPTMFIYYLLSRNDVEQFRYKLLQDQYVLSSSFEHFFRIFIFEKLLFIFIICAAIIFILCSISIIILSLPLIILFFFIILINLVLGSGHFQNQCKNKYDLIKNNIVFVWQQSYRKIKQTDKICFDHSITNIVNQSKNVTLNDQVIIQKIVEYLKNTLMKKNNNDPNVTLPLLNYEAYEGDENNKLLCEITENN